VEELISRGAPIRGSSWAYPNLVRRGKAGHIDVWPYFVQTLSTSPQNNRSTFASAKAALDLFPLSEIPLDERFRALLGSLGNPEPDPDPTPTTGEEWAKAGRVISSKNEQAMQEAIDALQACLEDMRSSNPGSKPTGMTT